MTELPPNIMDEINVAAYYLSMNNLPYDTLCWMLAERQIWSDLGDSFEDDGIRDEIIKPRAAQIYFSCCEYDVLCWLIAEFDIKQKHRIK